MTLENWIKLVRRLVMDPEVLPPVPEGEEAQPADPPPRWSTAEILDAGNAAIVRAVAVYPAVFQTGDTYAHQAPPVLWDGETPDDELDLATLAAPHAGQALAYMAAADLLADVLDAGAASGSEAHRVKGLAILAGGYDG